MALTSTDVDALIAAIGRVVDEPVEGRRQLLDASGVELPDTAEQRRQALPHPSPFTMRY